MPCLDCLKRGLKLRMERLGVKSEPAAEFYREHEDVVEVFMAASLEEEREDGVGSVGRDVGEGVAEDPQGPDHVLREGYKVEEDLGVGRFIEFCKNIVTIN